MWMRGIYTHMCMHALANRLVAALASNTARNCEDSLPTAYMPTAAYKRAMPNDASASCKVIFVFNLPCGHLAKQV